MALGLNAQTESARLGRSVFICLISIGIGLYESSTRKCDQRLISAGQTVAHGIDGGVVNRECDLILALTKDIDSS